VDLPLCGGVSRIWIKKKFIGNDQSVTPPIDTPCDWAKMLKGKRMAMFAKEREALRWAEL
jgi:hypothetical protein